MCHSAIRGTGTIGIELPFIAIYVQRVPAVPSDYISTLHRAIALFNWLRSLLALNISETLLIVVETSSPKTLNSISSTAQDSVITAKLEEHGESGECPLLCSALRCLCAAAALLPDGVSVTDTRYFLWSAHVFVLASEDSITRY